MIVKPENTILIVEDSLEDYEATLRALRKAGLANPIQHCEDGESTLDYLYQRGAFIDPARAPRPGIILFDLNLPGTDGSAVLAEIKNDPAFGTIPVIVLTSSSQPQDIEACYRAGANSYVKKPVDMDGFLEAIQRLAEYWFELVVLPRPPSPQRVGVTGG